MHLPPPMTKERTLLITQTPRKEGTTYHPPSFPPIKSPPPNHNSFKERTPIPNSTQGKNNPPPTILRGSDETMPRPWTGPVMHKGPGEGGVYGEENISMVGAGLWRRTGDIYVVAIKNTDPPTNDTVTQSPHAASEES
ncbi:hypothetical protein V502_08265 [Pseudogymnoascus sp. VKM F-4520 (FW-2644)]|nr:hypothetical protein V502_08265 [Pseudogymnoascus sp. VKM F-4520 (FW-2644)]